MDASPPPGEEKKEEASSPPPPPPELEKEPSTTNGPRPSGFTPPPTPPRSKALKEHLSVLLNVRFLLTFLLPLIFLWLLWFDPSCTLYRGPESAPGKKDGKVLGCKPDRRIGYGSCAFIQKTPCKNNRSSEIRCHCVPPKDYRALYAVTCVGGYWLFDTMPLAVAASFPLVYIPLMGIEEDKKTANYYAAEPNILVFGAVMLLSAGLIGSGLSQRLALKILAWSGGRFRKAAFLVSLFSLQASMWYPNSAVMLLILDLTDKMLEEIKGAVEIGALGEGRTKFVAPVGMVLEKEEEKEEEKPPPPPEDDAPPPQDPAEGPKKSVQMAQSTAAMELADLAKRESSLAEAKWNDENNQILFGLKTHVLLNSAISASIGGLFWPYGTTSGALFTSSGLLKMNGGNVPRISFGLWLSFTGPLLAVLIPLTLAYLDFATFTFRRLRRRNTGVKPETPVADNTMQSQEQDASGGEVLDFRDVVIPPGAEENMEEYFSKKYEDLGPFTIHEISILGFILITPLLMIWGDVHFPYASLSKAFRIPIFLNTAVVVTFIGLFIFLIPKAGLFALFRGPKSPEEKPAWAAITGWKTVGAIFPWGLVIFIGGGLALVGASENPYTHFAALTASPMSNWTVPTEVFLLVITGMSFFLACVITNTGAAFLMIRVILFLAIKKAAFRDCRLLLVATIAPSFAFIFPAGTPTMALIHMKAVQLNACMTLRKGFPLALVCCFILYIYAIGIATSVSCY